MSVGGAGGVRPANETVQWTVSRPNARSGAKGRKSRFHDCIKESNGGGLGVRTKSSLVLIPDFRDFWGFC
jgi:hypothetical protein